MTNDEVFRVLQAWANDNYAGLGANLFKLRLSDGRWVQLPIPGCCAPSTTKVPTEYDDLREKALHLLEAASDWKTSKKLANDAGYELDADTYKLLADLVKDGHMLKGKNGYKRAKE